MQILASVLGYVTSKLFLLLQKLHAGHFGEHFMLDGYECSKEALNNRSLVERLLLEIPGKTGMTVLGDVNVCSTDGHNPKDSGGHSGLLVIEKIDGEPVTEQQIGSVNLAESHFTIHTFPEVGFVTVDFYTCQEGLDTELIRNLLVEAFGIKKPVVTFVLRGVRYGSTSR